MVKFINSYLQYRFMKTRWDCLFELFEMKEAGLKRISEKTGASMSSTRQRLLTLLNEKIIIEKKWIYRPNKENPVTWHIFNIMKFCRNKGINYNLFLSKEFAKIAIIGIEKKEIRIAEFKGISYKTVRKYLSYLSRINLVFVISKKPLKVRFLEAGLFDEILALYKMERRIRKEDKSTMNSEEYKEIERLLIQIHSLRKNLDFAGMDEEQKIEFTSASTQLEGNTFTLDESKELILHDIIPEGRKLKETNEVKNYYAAVNYLVSHLEEPLSVQYILDMQRIAVFNSGTKEGIRAANVFIKGNPFYKIAQFQEILPKLQKLCEEINDFNKKRRNAKETIEFSSYVHNEFQHIHPFEDGNSRVTRLVWNYVLMKNGFPLINIYSNAKEEYLSLTKLSKERDDSKLNVFLTRIIKDNLFKQVRL